jgi:hypothetical protein
MAEADTASLRPRCPRRGASFARRDARGLEFLGAEIRVGHRGKVFQKAFNPTQAQCQADELDTVNDLFRLFKFKSNN